MTIREWRDKRLHRRCLFCTYYCAAHPLGPPYETKNTGWCRAKLKNVNDDIPKWFCDLYGQKEDAGMADLIDRDKLRLFPIRRDHYDKENGNEHFVFGIESVLEYVEQLPAVDAVPVVRCKDCVHYELGCCLKIYSDGNVNKDAWQKRTPNDFCSYGERRNDNG